MAFPPRKNNGIRGTDDSVFFSYSSHDTSSPLTSARARVCAHVCDLFYRSCQSINPSIMPAPHLLLLLMLSPPCTLKATDTHHLAADADCLFRAFRRLDHLEWRGDGLMVEKRVGGGSGGGAFGVVTKAADRQLDGRGAHTRGKQAGWGSNLQSQVSLGRRGRRRTD